MSQQEGERVRVLHLLSAATESTPPDEPRLVGNCGHECVASPQTHAMIRMNPEVEHVISCIDCYMEL